jgi:RimJ/RimL family protein N-acetyltransferase
VLNSGLTIRPISGPGEIELFNRLPYVLNEELADDLAAGRRRTEWMWVALRGDRLVARAAWWGQGGDAVPLQFDVFDFEAGSADDGARLLSTAMTAVPAGAKPPEYGRFVPPDWRDNPADRTVVEERLVVLEGAGARLLVERLRFDWRPGTPIAEPSGRLAFRPVRDSEEIIELMTRVLDGTLDAHSRAAMARLSPREAATEHYEEELAQYRSPREWWRVATLPDGEPVGFVTPARNNYNPVIGYLAVLPAHRGQGYIDAILAEGTRILAAQGVPRIRAATDLGNVPMARAFERAGYVNFERAINMVWDGKLDG